MQTKEFSMNSLHDIWNEIIRVLSRELTPTAISTWFDDCEPVELDDYKLVLKSGNDFKREIIINRFGTKLKAALYDLFSCEFDIRVLTPEELEDYQTSKDASNYEKIPDMALFTFDRFIVGNSNRFAFAAAKAVSEHPGGIDYNPLFIYGNSGLGKTHLLLAIGHAIKEADPKKKIAYVKGDEFTNKLVKALGEHKMEEFRNEFRNVDLFLMDDVQFIAGKIQTQEEFFHTFNAIYEDGHQIVITSDRPPKEMSTLEDRLRTRFEGGVLADIQPPDFETRLVIIRNKAAGLGLQLSDEAVEYIANNITANIRQLEGVIKKLTAYREILNEVITTESVKRAIEDVIRTGTDIPTPDKIIKETARYYNLETDDLRGQNRSKNIAEARQVSMYLIRSLTNLSLVDIGKQYENRNHATVLSSIKKIEDMLKNDPQMSAKIRDISSNINAG